MFEHPSRFRNLCFHPIASERFEDCSLIQEWKKNPMENQREGSPRKSIEVELPHRHVLVEVEEADRLDHKYCEVVAHQE